MSYEEGLSGTTTIEELVARATRGEDLSEAEEDRMFMGLALRASQRTLRRINSHRDQGDKCATLQVTFGQNDVFQGRIDVSFLDKDTLCHRYLRHRQAVGRALKVIDACLSEDEPLHEGALLQVKEVLTQTFLPYDREEDSELLKDIGFLPGEGKE